MDKIKRYSGIDKNPTGAITPTGNIIHDAWLAGLSPETETCEGWTLQGIDMLLMRQSRVTRRKSGIRYLVKRTG